MSHSCTGKPRAQQIAAAVIGNALEWYDFVIFGFMLVVISRLFFPASSDHGSLLLATATFGAGFVMRPVGGLLIGIYADRHGRKAALQLIMALMTIAMLMIALAPTHAAIGVAAPLIIVGARLLQGFATGGEFSSATSFLLEMAPLRQRGFYTSWQMVGQGLALLIGASVGSLLTHFLAPAAIDAWGWRIPFLLSAVLLAISIRSRMNLHESPVFSRLREKNALAKTPLRECFRDRHTLGRMALLFFCISAGGSLLFFSAQVYTGIFLKTVINLSAAQAGTLVMVSTLALFPATLFCGWLSDRIGRRPVLLAGLISGALTIFPVFQGLLHYGSLAVPDTTMIVVLLLVLVVPLACITGPQTATLPELFPARTRYTAVALPHNLAAGWIGGMSPFMVTWLGVRFGDPLAGLWYPTGLLILASVIGLLFLPEVRNRPLDS